MASTLFTSHAMLAAYADARLPGSIADRELCPKALRPRTPLPLAPRNHEKPHFPSTTSIASSNYLFSVVCGLWRFLASAGVSSITSTMYIAASC